LAYLMRILVPKLCLGTQLQSKLCFEKWKQSFQDNCIAKQSLATRNSEIAINMPEQNLNWITI
jgi:hypothetical protein